MCLTRLQTPVDLGLELTYSTIFGLTVSDLSKPDFSTIAKMGQIALPSRTSSSSATASLSTASRQSCSQFRHRLVRIANTIRAYLQDLSDKIVDDERLGHGWLPCDSTCIWTAVDGRLEPVCFEFNIAWNGRGTGLAVAGSCSQVLDLV